MNNDMEYIVVWKQILSELLSCLQLIGHLKSQAFLLDQPYLLRNLVPHQEKKSQWKPLSNNESITPNHGSEFHC